MAECQTCFGELPSEQDGRKVHTDATGCVAVLLDRIERIREGCYSEPNPMAAIGKISQILAEEKIDGTAQ